MPETLFELINVARDAKGNAYAPWTEEEQGAALLAANDAGDLAAFRGCTVENVNYTNSRSAIESAVADALKTGHHDFKHLALSVNEWDDDAVSRKTMQVLHEFADPDLQVVVDDHGNVEQYGLNTLPDAADGSAPTPMDAAFTVANTYTEINTDEDYTDELISIARDAQESAYAPVSKYRVGTALLTHDGRVYPGCNIENQDIGVTMHGEGSAVRSAVVDGYGRGDFEAIVVATDGEGAAPFPCGYCRQTLAEFDEGTLRVIADGADVREEQQLAELYPSSFDPSNL